MKYTVPIVFACTLITISAFAKSDSSGKKLTDAERIARREARRKEFNEYYGGFIQDTRQQKGMIAVVNAQSELDVKCLTAPIEWLKSEVKIRFEVTSKTFDFPNVAKYGAMTIYLISDENIPSLLIAPEQNGVQSMFAN
jgi:hypothetical protein